ncbi:ATP-binding protein [Streptomyces sp. NPDC007264]|uniref:ATP-binding protein n=1 Tax=Streptomyces sp. NPDC007264 TaxID=3364777 RepID=UPI0036DAE7CE
MAPPSLPQPVDRLSGHTRSHRSDVFHLPAVPAAVGTARRNVRALLERWGTGRETSDNAVLVTSELVTNAVMHTGSERVVCRVRTDGRRLRIEVEDENRAAPVALSSGPDDQGGRGLALVCALSGDRGVRDAPGGTGHVIWAEIVPEAGEAVATGPPSAPYLGPVPHPAEGPPPHGTTARL